MSRSAATDPPLIAGAFEVEASRALPLAADGHTAYSVIDRANGRTGLMAVQIHADAPARAEALQRFQAGPLPGVLAPIAFGPARDSGGRKAQFLICQAPPGPPILPTGATEFPPWDEQALLAQVLRPAAHALEGLRQRHLTHRAIRPANLFRAGVMDPVSLGCAWAAPPAFAQPAIYEPPYMSMCHPAARGEGSTADDVYALGVTLLVLALGHEPCRGLDPQTLVAQQLERGALAVLVGDRRLPPIIADLLRSMLAEDPEHRPTPALLADTELARGRRVAARPARRAQRPLEIGAQKVWTARTLAFALTRDSESGLQSLRAGSINAWIRRSLGDSALAVRLDEAVKIRNAQEDIATARDDAALVMRAVALLDPLAPLCWNGAPLWPDALGPLLAVEGERAGAPPVTDLAEMIQDEAAGSWATLRAERCDAPMFRLNAHQHRALWVLKGPSGGANRLMYHLNPLLPCRSPLLREASVVRLDEILPALDEAASNGSLPRDTVLDTDLHAFIAARSEGGLESELGGLAAARTAEHAGLATLRLYAALQQRTRCAAVPALARAVALLVQPSLAVFSGRSRRAARAEAMGDIASTGNLPAMLALLADPEAIARDRGEREAALARVVAIDHQVDLLRAGRVQRRASAAHLGQEAVATAGTLGLIYTVMSALLP